MIQDISPSIFYNEFKDKEPSKNSRIFCFHKRKILLGQTDRGERLLPTFAVMPKDIIKSNYHYLFCVDETEYFLYLNEETIDLPSFQYESVQILRENIGKELQFVGITAYHLYQWYENNHFCGRCANELSFDSKERMLYCDKCGNMIYPKIAPAIIVGVTNGNKILMTKYAGRAYKKYALIAGFSEIGETLEDTVRREVMEEAGVKVKNITYYKSQPWGFDSNLLVGYYAELDGPDEITMDTEELSYAGWLTKDDVDIVCDGVSLTNEMMYQFFQRNTD